MMRKAMLSLGAAALLAAGLALPTSAQTADTVIVTVGETEITLGHIIAALSTLPEQYQGLDDQTLYDGLVDQLIQQNVLAQSLGEPSKGTRLAIENQTSGLLAGEAIGRVADEAVTEEAIAAAYAEQFGDAEPTKEFNASHILVETEEEAIEIKGLIDEGQDFAELAQARSTGPSGPNGGALGWFGPGMMVPEFEAAVMALEDGAVSGPVQTQFGWHIVKLNESRTQAGPPLADVQDGLRSQLERDAIQVHIDALMEEADIARADVTIDASLIRKQNLVVD